MLDGPFGILLPPNADAAMMVGIIVLRLAIGSLPGWIAMRKGYSFAAFTMVGFFWPIASLAIAIYLPKRERSSEREGHSEETT